MKYVIEGSDALVNEAGTRCTNSLLVVNSSIYSIDPCNNSSILARKD